ncbi:hypothetical protein ABIC09_002743 [Bradyrhizobium sp. S3.12.5]|uniref:hypothetical protein n=1 Tax=Bradyrhizobium sp. S3.12.5 TaxID=3156386 RepID=UPI00339470C6
MAFLLAALKIVDRAFSRRSAISAFIAAVFLGAHILASVETIDITAVANPDTNYGPRWHSLHSFSKMMARYAPFCSYAVKPVFSAIPQSAL